jgi:hypothetical protein
VADPLSIPVVEAVDLEQDDPRGQGDEAPEQLRKGLARSDYRYRDRERGDDADQVSEDQKAPEYEVPVGTLDALKPRTCPRPRLSSLGLSIELLDDDLASRTP